MVCSRYAQVLAPLLISLIYVLDRKTATKELSRLTRREKEQDLEPKEKERLAAKIHVCRVNLNYTIYYPLTEKYISIYPKSNGAADAPAEPAPQKHEPSTGETKPPMWAVVARCMEDKTLDLLREGKLNINANGEKMEVASSRAARSTKSSKEQSKKEHHKEKTVQNDKRMSQDDKNGRKKEKSARKEQVSRQVSRKHEAPQVNAENGDESDGGFFE